MSPDTQCGSSNWTRHNADEHDISRLRVERCDTYLRLRTRAASVEQVEGDRTRRLARRFQGIAGMQRARCSRNGRLAIAPHLEYRNCLVRRAVVDQCHAQADRSGPSHGAELESGRANGPQSPTEPSVPMLSTRTVRDVVIRTYPEPSGSCSGIATEVVGVADAIGDGDGFDVAGEFPPVHPTVIAATQAPSTGRPRDLTTTPTSVSHPWFPS